jgi:ectoine hydroxylase-related dioxygenase (phytanoyl-CoA dioxygenase family)
MTESLRLKKIETPVLNTARPSEDSLDGWKSQLVDVGYIIIPNALPAPAVDHFRERVASFEPSVGYGSASLVRLFEKGKDFVDLLLNEPIFSLMERVFGDRMHIIALQGHRMVSGNEISRFHADEIYLQRPEDVGDDVEYPPIVNTINCHYYLVDVPMELGPTEVVPGSHRACRQPTPTDGDPPHWRGQSPVSLTCNAGDCILYSNQMWHRGAINQTDRARLSVVPGYARRFVAQRFWPFLNYNLTREILDECTPRQRELLGEHPRGAYG